jgi:hypothetical protein
MDIAQRQKIALRGRGACPGKEHTDLDTQPGFDQLVVIGCHPSRVSNCPKGYRVGDVQVVSCLVPSLALEEPNASTRILIGIPRSTRNLPAGC